MGEGDPFKADVGNEDFETTINTSIPPEGLAIVQLLNVEKAVSKTSGNPMWVWEFSLREYLEPGDIGNEFQDELLKVYTALSKAAMWKLEETLKALGVDIGEAGAVSFKKEQVIGVIAKAAIKHNDFNGKLQVNIDALAPAPEGVGTKREMPSFNHPDVAPPAGEEDIPF